LRTNLRTDEYGGSIDNRSKIVLEIIDAIRSRTPPSFIIGIKLNCVEFQDGGFDADQCRTICTSLERCGWDFVELSGGNYEELAFAHKKESTRSREAFFAEFADAIAPSLSKTKTFITGGFRTTANMVKALDTVDGIGLARPLCQEPYLCADLLSRRVCSIIKQSLDQDNITLTSAVAGALMNTIADGNEPVSLDNETHVEALMKAIGRWLQIVTSDEGVAGWPEIESSMSA
jgi:2,4-dienoyl-CoA reductase-like NADH-dependent reductase (Old Yellow Enzyme family)